MCMCFPKITQERDSNKSNTEMRFPDFGLEMLIAKIINMWQLGISAASFILKDLKVLCRLGKKKRSCFSWWEAAISRLGCSRCLMLEKYIFYLKKRVVFWFRTLLRHWGLEEQLQTKAAWCPSITPRSQHQDPSLPSLPANQASSLLSIPNHNLMGSSRNQTSREFIPRNSKCSTLIF